MARVTVYKPGTGNKKASRRTKAKEDFDKQFEHPYLHVSLSTSRVIVSHVDDIYANPALVM